MAKINDEISLHPSTADLGKERRSLVLPQQVTSQKKVGRREAKRTTKKGKTVERERKEKKSQTKHVAG